MHWEGSISAGLMKEFYKVEEQILPLVTFQSQAFGITLLSPQKGESLHGAPPQPVL